MVLSIFFVLATVYLLIPGKLQLNATVSLNVAMPGVSRTLANDSNWKKWWPGESLFIYNKKQFVPRGKIFNAIEVIISSGDEETQSRIDLLLIKADSMSIEWHAERSNSGNPLKRYAQYREIKSIQKDMQAILGTLKIFMEKNENIYGFHITETRVTDSVLISTRRKFNKKPGIRDIDQMIRQLKKYITENGAVEKNSPMLNIQQVDTSHFETMVAIAVDRKLPETKEFAPKFLLKGGNILEAEIRGGPYAIEKAFKELEDYRSDYKYESPAIPYQLLVTDRTKESDTSKWVTKLYYPIF